MSELPLIRVAAAILTKSGRCLLTQRPPGTHMSGYWEFPGGKLEIDETPELALARELSEELGIEIEPPTPLWTIVHEYPERIVELNFLAAKIRAGEPKALASSALGWYRPGEMPALPLLPADLEILAALSEFVATEAADD